MNIQLRFQSSVVCYESYIIVIIIVVVIIIINILYSVIKQ